MSAREERSLCVVDNHIHEDPRGSGKLHYFQVSSYKTPSFSKLGK